MASPIFGLKKVRGTPKYRGACRDDAQKLCAGIGRSNGRGAVLDRLASHKDQLSDSEIGGKPRQIRK